MGFLHLLMYNKEEITAKCIEVIKTEKLTFFTDLVIYIEPALSTLYEWELEKSEDIKRELSKNKFLSKKKMRCKWEESDNATLQIAAYKLIADKEEIEALTINKVDATLKGELGIKQITGMEIK
jgi:hypothetical protein